jgi:hypothetical protein
VLRAIAILALAAAAFSAGAAAQQPSASIDPPAGSRLLLEATGKGAQVYSCAATPDSGFKWILKGPDAKLFDSARIEIGLHFAGPTWKLTDGSQVEGEPVANRPAAEAGAVPWLLLRAKAGTATGKLAGVAFIQRTQTHGGVAPATGCNRAVDVGKTARVNYSATYSFYSAAQ